MTSKPIPQFQLPDGLEAQYVNFARISHTASEFILDFSLLLPDGGQPKIDSRLVMAPTAIKLFLRALSENIARYESKFGEITLPLKHTLADELFKPNTNPDEEKD